jgi:hypothetical protein
MIPSCGAKIKRSAKTYGAVIAVIAAKITSLLPYWRHIKTAPRAVTGLLLLLLPLLLLLLPSTGVASLLLLLRAIFVATLLLSRLFAAIISHRYWLSGYRYFIAAKTLAIIITLFLPHCRCRHASHHITHCLLLLR